MSDDERRARLERALAYGGPTHSLADVVRLIEEHQAQLWERGDGVIVTEVLTFPLVKICNYFLVAGELAPCLALQPEIDRWAISEGCTAATATGRMGWIRAAASSGWQLSGYHFTKKLVA